jgi:hypothetical protein
MSVGCEDEDVQQSTRIRERAIKTKIVNEVWKASFLREENRE